MARRRPTDAWAPLVQTRTRAARFTLTVDTAWDAVFAGLEAFHEEANGSCWLYPPLRAALREPSATAA